MRLINSTTLEVEEFFGNSIPKYAILSHRWQGSEVTFQDIQYGTAARKQGYDKIKRCCAQAVDDGLQHAWIDACCIDKTNSSELSEAINSMYQWYKNAAVCYVYMFDVEIRSPLIDLSFEKSAWHTRGWTLQELIAPEIVKFYASNWQYIGEKTTLRTKISAVTGIHVDALAGEPLEKFSIAQRMSWASTRTTTRVEDVAYSLLGIFDVHMPMLYGEGKKAFIRLQEEIMKHSDDHTLFAWSRNQGCYRGLLAESPAEFCNCKNITRSSPKLNRTPYSITNIGLSIELCLIPWAMETYLAALDCEIESYLYFSRIGIFLVLLPEDDNCARIEIGGTDKHILTRSELSMLVRSKFYRRVYVRQTALHNVFGVQVLYGFYLRNLPIESETASGAEQSLAEVISYNKWSLKERIIEIPTGSSGTAGVLWFNGPHGYYFLKLGFDNMFNPCCQLGGPLWEATSEIYRPDGKGTSYKNKMDSAWIRSGSNNVLIGDRYKGLDEEQEGTQIRIAQIVREGRQMWMVDMKLTEGSHKKGRKHKGVTCDGCNQGVYGIRYRCLFCPDFDYCEECYQFCEKRHPDHNFKAIFL